MPNEKDEAYHVLIDQIWTQFDTDGNGTLDFEETKNFFKHFM